jgi:hypothetical protein
MRDLLVIVPSRGRPDAVRELCGAVKATTRERTDLLIAFDDDDPAREGYEKQRDGLSWVSGPRASMVPWTNQIAAARAGSYRALCSMGDDHRPRTKGWDTQFLTALGKTGGTGIAYGDDLLQGVNLPTAAVVSSDIVKALGWMCLPSLRHYYADNVWRDLGQSAGCLHYLPGVIIEHLHPLATGDQPDGTYLDAYRGYEADRSAYQQWLAGSAIADAGAIRNLLPRSAYA